MPFVRYDSYDIQFDSQLNQAIIFFRGKRHVLTGPYHTREQAVVAGEKYLLTLGWTPPAN